MTKVREIVLLAGALGLVPFPGRAEAATQKATAGAQFAKGGGHRFLWGADYRDLWATPVTVEVLDLAAEKGGLTPVRRVGGQQTKGLALRGQDGGNYTFRGLDKDASELLDEDLRGTIVDSILDDQMSAQHPGSEIVARGLLEAAGVPVPAWRLVVLPDSPLLGEFQKDFAGAMGMFAEYPSAQSDRTPGFLGATEIIDHLTLYERLTSSPTEQADTAAFLRARLVDILMGDWDRHRKQWRWARVPGNPRYVPIPEDRDQAFSRYEGVIPGMGRRRDARLQAFGPKYRAIKGLSTNGREQDRYLLAATSLESFQEAAREIQGRVTNEAIDRAVGFLPEEWRKLDGPRLTTALRARRDALPEAARRFYLRLADRADVFLTDQADVVTAVRAANGDLTLTAAVAPEGGSPSAPYYERVFHPQETGEIRLYTKGGNDKVTATGGRGKVRLRVIGGVGTDVLDDSRGGGSRLSDSEGANRVVSGPGTSEDDREYTPPAPPKNAPWVPPQDFGSATWTVPWLSYGSDLGIFLGWGVQKQTYRFRKHPFGADHLLRAGWALGESSGKAAYRGLFRRENGADFFALNAYVSGVETLRFYGFGNETASTGETDSYKAKESTLLLYPSYVFVFGKKTGLTVGPLVRYSENRTGRNTFVEEQQPYGFGKFGQVGAYTAFVLDRRDNPQYSRHGVFLAARAAVWPEAWDVEKTYGKLGGNLNTYLSGGQWVTLALRGGGEHAFGEYTYRDGASLGGGGLGGEIIEETGFNLRGYRANRFVGDSSLYGNADLRLRLGRVTLLVPCHVGVFGLFDVGRVWLKGESSDTWHTSVGGGVWISMLNYRNTFSAYIAHSKESDIFHVGGSFTF